MGIKYQNQINRVYCQQNQIGVRFCASPYCQVYSVMCKNKQCNCHIEHRTCLIFADVNKVIQNLEQKNNSKYKCFEILIDYCKQKSMAWQIQKQKLQQMMNQGRILLYLQNEIRLLKSIKSIQQNKEVMKSCLLYNVIKSTIKQPLLDTILCQQQFKTFFDRVNKQTQNSISQLIQIKNYLDDTFLKLQKIDCQQKVKQQQKTLIEKLIEDNPKQEQDNINNKNYACLKVDQAKVVAQGQEQQLIIIEQLNTNNSLVVSSQ